MERGSMSHRALQLGLALSLVLNVALLGGAAFGLFADGRDDAPDPQAHIAAVAEELDLSAQETARLRDFRERTLTAIAVRRQDSAGSVRERLVPMLDDETWDREAVIAILDARTRERNAFWAGVGADLHAWVRSLPENKQARFVEMAKDRDFFRKLFAREPE
jgi:hypothetical protein